MSWNSLTVKDRRVVVGEVFLTQQPLKGNPTRTHFQVKEIENGLHRIHRHIVLDGGWTDTFAVTLLVLDEGFQVKGEVHISGREMRQALVEPQVPIWFWWVLNARAKELQRATSEHIRLHFESPEIEYVLPVVNE